MFTKTIKNIFNFFIIFYNLLVDMFYPKKCLKCQKYGTYFCDNCFNSILLNTNLTCYRCRKISLGGKNCHRCRNRYNLSTKGILVATDWKNETLQKIIKSLKYKLVKELSQPSGKILAEFLILHWDQISWLNSKKKIYFIPIPLHRRRLIERGFNQSELITCEMINFLKLSNRWSNNFYYLDQLLIREKYSHPQAKITDARIRQRNIKGAFSLRSKNKLDSENNRKLSGEIIRGEIVVLVDDIITTGATIEEAAQTLKQLQPKEIWGLAVARGR